MTEIFFENAIKSKSNKQSNLQGCSMTLTSFAKDQGQEKIVTETLQIVLVKSFAVNRANFLKYEIYNNLLITNCILVL